MDTNSIIDKIIDNLQDLKAIDYREDLKKYTLKSYLLLHLENLEN